MKKNASVILDKILIKLFVAILFFELISVIFFLFETISKNISLYYVGIACLASPIFILLPWIPILFIDLINIIKQKNYIKWNKN
ncbi:hypothetical protein [Spiroplasma sp. hyd1]|uniref:hypothetical protein n=1 Tax=Spiroplasma sp. hyd1 TaxID=1609976 RepID=UPI0018DDB96D|nr:hypothetical protein [Spiroplasma sp. hyd1]MBH8623311.1 hypothetical protein [Spiroplasma sp. hyd1]